MYRHIREGTPDSNQFFFLPLSNLVAIVYIGAIEYSNPACEQRVLTNENLVELVLMVKACISTVSCCLNRPVGPGCIQSTTLTNWRLLTNWYNPAVLATMSSGHWSTCTSRESTGTMTYSVQSIYPLNWLQ